MKPAALFTILANTLRNWKYLTEMFLTKISDPSDWFTLSVLKWQVCHVTHNCVNKWRINRATIWVPNSRLGTTDMLVSLAVKIHCSHPINSYTPRKCAVKNSNAWLDTWKHWFILPSIISNWNYRAWFAWLLLIIVIKMLKLNSKIWPSSRSDARTDITLSKLPKYAWIKTENKGETKRKQQM